MPHHFAFFAPAGAIPPAQRDSALPQAINYFQRRGHKITLADHLLAVEQRFAGSPAQRCEDFTRLLENPDIDALIAIRGGFGCSQWLPLIDWGRVHQALQNRKRLKVFGYSDVTALLLALKSKAEVADLIDCYFGPMALSDFGSKDPHRFMEAEFWNALEGREVKLQVALPPNASCLNAIKGRLWGGNLALISHLIGSPFLPTLQAGEGILFLEDVNEAPYQVDRMLWQLHLSGILGQQQALLLGDFGPGNKASNPSYPHDYSLTEVFEQWRRRLSIPVLEGFPTGHIPGKASLPLLVRAHLEPNSQGYSLSCSNQPLVKV